MEIPVKMKTYFGAPVFCGLILLAAFPSGLLADVESLTWTGGSFPGSAHPQTVGWSFTANQTIDVSSLDWYDPTGTNNIEHTVDIWTNTGTLEGTACVGSGCAGSTYSATAEYWQTPVSLSLAVGSYYIGGWVDTGDPFEYELATTATASDITFGYGFYSLGGSSTPTSLTGVNPCCIGIVGPNFEQSAAVPEPSSLILLSSMLLGIAFFARKRFARGNA